MKSPHVSRTVSGTLVALFALGLLAATTAPSFAAPAPHGAEVSAARFEDGPFAVVELFTSEGCESCPPADALLAELAVRSREKRLPLFPLAFHVDFWDRLGWKDPFGARFSTARQNRYAEAWHKSDLYTPQMVVNGTVAFVGSERAAAERAIRDAFARPAGLGVTLWRLSNPNPRAVLVGYGLSRGIVDAELHVLLVERGLESKVLAGENRGETLRHENVVRAMKTLRVDSAISGDVLLEWPDGARKQNCFVVGVVQDSKTMEIRGAGALELR